MANMGSAYVVSFGLLCYVCAVNSDAVPATSIQHTEAQLENTSVSMSHVTHAPKEISSNSTSEGTSVLVSSSTPKDPSGAPQGNTFAAISDATSPVPQVSFGSSEGTSFAATSDNASLIPSSGLGRSFTESGPLTTAAPPAATTPGRPTGSTPFASTTTGSSSSSSSSSSPPPSTTTLQPTDGTSVSSKTDPNLSTSTGSTNFPSSGSSDLPSTPVVANASSSSTENGTTFATTTVAPSNETHPPPTNETSTQNDVTNITTTAPDTTVSEMSPNTTGATVPTNCGFPMDAESREKDSSSKPTIIAMGVCIAILATAIVVFGLWFYNARWKLHKRDGPLLSLAESPVTSRSYSSVQYINDGVENISMRDA